MPSAIFSAGKQLPDTRVEGHELALMTEGKRKQVGVGYLPMTDERERLEDGGLNQF